MPMLKAGVLSVLILALSGCRSEPALFEKRSGRETGITFANRLQEDDTLHNPVDFEYLYNGAGVGVGDFDGDGLQDLYFAGNMVSSRLYLNRRGLEFEDVTGAAGVGTDVWATGVTVVDIDQDGRLDLYVGVAGPRPGAKRANLLFINQGPGSDGVPRFVERAREYGIADTGWTTQGVFLDHDLDGDLDLYLLTNADEPAPNSIRPRRIDGEAESTDRLYRNNGDGTFTNVSREAGITIEGYGLGVAVADLNQDGWPDLYVSNDFQSNDLVWINNHDGTFTNRAADYLRHQSHSAMGVDVADVDNDALPDVVVVDMLPPDNHRQKTMLPGGQTGVFDRALYYGYEPQYVRNTLQVNNGPRPDGTPSFSEVGQLAGIHQTDWSWAPLLADFDNDGDRDLFVTNGYGRDVTNLDFIAGTNRSLMGATPSAAEPLRDVMRQLPPVRLSNYLFRNDGDLAFTDRTEAWRLDTPSLSYGAAYADLDNDGDLDLVVNNLNEQAFLFENRSERLPDRNHLRVVLRGPRGNRQGYGAKVIARRGGTVQYHDHSPFRGYKSTMEEALHFGLGAAASVDSLEVRWPDGSYQLLTNVPANSAVALDHRDAGPPPPAEETPRDLFFRAVAAPPGLDYAHRERVFDDFALTPLLPHRFSQNGPGIAVGDVDGNGLDDVYIGTDRGQEKSIFLQLASGRFERRVIDADTEHEDMGALFLDAEGDGDLDLYVASGGGFPAPDAEFYRDRLYVNEGAGRLQRDPRALPAAGSSGSVVTAADYDHDGDLDLFVGGRVDPGRYPLPPRSFLLRNDSRAGGAPRFTDVTGSVAPGLSDVGLVTSALWTDPDGDGLVDLMVAGEWMPVTLFRNEGSRFVDATADAGLAATSGWWNSLAAGDFDADGDTDYLAGNLGLNSPYRASVAEPVRVHAADFDENGTIDPVLSRYIGGESYPVHSLELLVKQMLAMKFRFPTHAEYAEATLEETLSERERAGAHVAEAVTFASSYLENRGNGTFAVRPLPRRAQFAPVNGILADDVNGDGHLDALLVGNSFATEVQTGRYDASTGSVLLGDGKGGFRHLSGTRSGFYVDGDARGIARLALGDGRSLLLVTQNADSLEVFAPDWAEPRYTVPLRPDDAFAVLSLADGGTRRQEIHHGSGYLSQSSRLLALPRGVRAVVVHDSRGRTREIQVTSGVGESASALDAALRQRAAPVSLREATPQLEQATDR